MECQKDQIKEGSKSGFLKLIAALTFLVVKICKWLAHRDSIIYTLDFTSVFNGKITEEIKNSLTKPFKFLGDIHIVITLITLQKLALANKRLQ